METFSRIRRSRANRPSWPDPHLSVGHYIGKIGRDCCWEATGPARETFVKLGPDIKFHLDRRSEPLPSWVTYSVYMVGSCPRTASPTIIFCSSDSTLRREVRKMVKDSGLLGRYPGLRTGDMARAPDFNQLVQLATVGGTASDDQSISESSTQPQPTIYAVPSPTAPGMHIYIQDGSQDFERPRKATVGGVVEFAGRYYYLTAGHAFRNDHNPFTTRPALADDQEFDIDDQSDSESDFSTDDVEATSRGSVTPEYASSEASLSFDGGLSRSSTGLSEGINDWVVTEIGSDVGIENSLSESTIQMEASHVPAQSSLTKAGELFLTSFDTQCDSLDYALIDIGSDTPPSNEIEFVSGHDTHTAMPLNVSRIGLIDAPVVAATGSRGPVTGRLSGTTSFMCLPGNMSCQEVYTVHLDGPLEKGDCGSWVMDADTGDLYGHIVAGCPDSGVAYIIPAYRVFQRIGERLGGILRLPSYTKELLPLSAEEFRRTEAQDGRTATGQVADSPEEMINPLSLSNQTMDSNSSAPQYSTRAPLSEDYRMARDLTIKFRRILSTRRMTELQHTLSRSPPTLRSSPGAPPSYQSIEPLPSYQNLRNLPLIPQPPRDGYSLRFRNFMQSLSRIPLAWENSGLLDEALCAIPLERIYNEADEESQVFIAEAASLGVDKKPAWGYQDCVIRALLRWFKRAFFIWVNNPACTKCYGPTTAKGLAGPTPDEMARSAHQVELFQCSACHNFERFPRYADVWVLLETRRGRCGEWANCFGMLCRAVGSRVRWVWSSEDHVWTEVYSHHRKRWVHVDVCEEAFDNPRLYTEGWGSKISYCIAFSVEGATDVTRRYVRKPPQQARVRNRAPESAVLHIVEEITTKLREKASQEDKKRLKGEDLREQRELSSYMLNGLITGLTQLNAIDIANPQPARSSHIEEESADERKERQERFHRWIRARYDIGGTEERQERFDPDRDVI